MAPGAPQAEMEQSSDSGALPVGRDGVSARPGSDWFSLAGFRLHPNQSSPFNPIRFSDRNIWGLLLGGYPECFSILLTEEPQE